MQQFQIFCTGLNQTATMADKSPGWKKPSKIVKVLRRKKSSETSGALKPQGIHGENSKEPVSAKSASNTVQKRKNPFGFIANKRQKLESLTGNSSNCDVTQHSDDVEEAKENQEEGPDQTLFSALHSHHTMV